MALLCAVDVAVLTSAQPDGARLLRRLEHPHAWVAEVGADAALTELAGAALWLAATWLAVCLLAVGGAALPGGGGRCARRVVRLVLPAAAYRLTVGVAGFGIALAPAVADAAAAELAGAVTLGAAATSGAAKPPPPVWPSDTAPTDTAPTDTAPTDTAPTDTAPPLRKAAPATGPRRPAGTVLVQRGDSLWSISREHLPATASAAGVVRAWPRWYAANRRTIGSDPNLLLPGQVLHAPPDAAPAAED